MTARRRHVLAVVACGLTWGGALGQLIGRQYGSTAAERRCLPPGDTIPDGPPGSAWFVVRRAQPAWLDVAYRALVIPADGVMATGMWHGLKRRAEANVLARTGRRALPA